MSEETIQRTALSLVSALYPDFVISVSLNGITLPGTPEQKSRLMQSLKANFFRKGIPDVSIYLPDSVILNLEFKRPKVGVQSDDQKQVELDLRKLGHNYHIVTDTNSVFAAIAEHTELTYRQFCFRSLDQSQPIPPFPPGTPWSVIEPQLKSLYHLN